MKQKFATIIGIVTILLALAFGYYLFVGFLTVGNDDILSKNSILIAIFNLVGAFLTSLIYLKLTDHD